MLDKPHILPNIPPAFDFHKQDPKTGQFITITDQAEREKIGKEISLITLVGPKSAACSWFREPMTCWCQTTKLAFLRRP